MAFHEFTTSEWVGALVFPPSFLPIVTSRISAPHSTALAPTLAQSGNNTSSETDAMGVSDWFYAISPPIFVAGMTQPRVQAADAFI